jgi:hypothetical protein
MLLKRVWDETGRIKRQNREESWRAEEVITGIKKVPEFDWKLLEMWFWRLKPPDKDWLLYLVSFMLLRLFSTDPLPPDIGGRDRWIDAMLVSLRNGSVDPWLGILKLRRGPVGSTDAFSVENVGLAEQRMNLCVDTFKTNKIVGTLEM